MKEKLMEFLRNLVPRFPKFFELWLAVYYISFTIPLMSPSYQSQCKADPGPCYSNNGF